MPLVGATKKSPPIGYIVCCQMDFEGKFEAERLSRLEREGRILKQLADHEQDVASDFDAERVSKLEAGELNLAPTDQGQWQAVFESVGLTFIM